MSLRFFKKTSKLPKEKTFDLVSRHAEYLSGELYETFQEHVENIVSLYECDGLRQFKESSVFFDWQNPHVILQVELRKTLNYYCQREVKGDKQGKAILFYWQQQSLTVRLKCQLERFLAACHHSLGDDETYALRDLMFQKFIEFEKACIPQSVCELYDEEIVCQYRDEGQPQLLAFIETFHGHLLAYKQACLDETINDGDELSAKNISALFCAIELLKPISVKDTIGHLALV